MQRRRFVGLVDAILWKGRPELLSVARRRWTDPTVSVSDPGRRYSPATRCGRGWIGSHWKF